MLTLNLALAKQTILSEQQTSLWLFYNYQRSINQQPRDIQYHLVIEEIIILY